MLNMYRELFLLSQRISDLELQNRELQRYCNLIFHNSKEILSFLKRVRTINTVEYVRDDCDDSGIWKGPTSWD